VDCFMGIDIGTGSSRGVVTDLAGNILAEHSVGHGISLPHPGWAEQDAESVWWRDLVALSRALLKDFNLPAASIRGLGISTISPCVLPIDAGGKPLRPGILYGIDTRAGAEIGEIEALVGPDAVFAIGGQHLSSQSCVPKIRWIQKNEGEVWAKTAKILSAAGYLVYRLTGRYTLDIYDAMAYGPLFDLRRCCWVDAVPDLDIPSSLLPELLWSREIAGTVSPEAAELTGLAVGTAVLTGTADAAAEALSAGLSQVGDLMMMYGSSNFFILKTQDLVPQGTFWASNFLEEGTSVLAGGMSTAGSLFKWLTETFPGRSFEQWEALADECGPGADGLVLLPYFAGERTPINNPYARGVLFGLDLRTRPGAVYRAFQEALGYGIRHIMEALEDSGAQVDRILAIGGVSRSRDLMQVVSDVTGRVQLLPRQKTGAAYGDAFLAAQGLGFFPDTAGIRDWVVHEAEVLPRTEAREVYEKGYQKFRGLYAALEPLMKPT